MRIPVTFTFRGGDFCLSEPLPHIHPFVQDADYCYVSAFGNSVEYDVTACFQPGADHLAGAAVASLFYGDLNEIVFP